MRLHYNKGRLLLGSVLLLALGVLVLGGSLWRSMQSQSDLLPLGQQAPDFTATTNTGSTVHLSEQQGKKRVVLVFYPGDNTPLCTAQLCAFRDNWSALESQDAVVLGVNPASKTQHSAFASKNHLPFPLLVDTDNEIAQRYGCRALFGIVKRTVYLIDKKGVVVWVKRGNPSPMEILQVLKTLKEPS